MSRRARTRAPARAAKELSLWTGYDDTEFDDGEPDEGPPAEDDPRTPIGPFDCAEQTGARQ